MRKLLLGVLAALISISSIVPAEAKDRRKITMPLRQHKMTAAYSVQTVSVRTGCFSPRLEGILAHIAARTGQRPLVTSGYRPHAHRSKSQHKHCKAADIRVPGVPERTVIAAARTAPGIGGIGRYCNGIIHVDIGPKRTWTDC